jgi:putative solute:sodium symporter small subunit
MPRVWVVTIGRLPRMNQQPTPNPTPLLAQKPVDHGLVDAGLVCGDFWCRLFARDLNFSFFGWPFSFWVGAQGALGVYVLIVGVYAYLMNRLDEAHSLNED